MGESALLSELMSYGFQLSGQRVKLGFDSKAIEVTMAKLGNPVPELAELFGSHWPSMRYWLGLVELLGPEDINYEHQRLLPGCLIIHHGFLVIGTNGSGSCFSYAVDDGHIYLISHESIAENSVILAHGECLPSVSAIKGVAMQKWDSMGSFLKWTFDELQSMAHCGNLGIRGENWKGSVSGIVGK